MKQQQFKIERTNEGVFLVKAVDGKWQKPFLDTEGFVEIISDLGQEKKINSSQMFDLFTDWLENPNNMDTMLKEDHTPVFMGEALKGALRKLMQVTKNSKIAEESEHGVAMIVCENCGNHGKFYTADVSSANFNSKEEGRFMLANMLEKKKITLAGKEAMEKELNANTNIPEETSEEDQMMDLFSAMFGVGNIGIVRVSVKS